MDSILDEFDNESTRDRVGNPKAIQAGLKCAKHGQDMARVSAHNRPKWKYQLSRGKQRYGKHKDVD